MGSTQGGESAIKTANFANYANSFEGRELQVVLRDTFDNEPEGKRPFEFILMMNMGPVAAHMPAHVGRHIGMPLAFAANSIPSQHDGKLGGKKVVIWCNIARALVGLVFPTK
jgi:hypothetical protein